jgi:predicted dehydrogenase
VVGGTEGLIEVRSYEQGVMIYREGRTSSPDTVYMPTLYESIIGVYRDKITYFIRCVREGEQSSIPLEEGLKGVMVAEAIMRSADRREEIVVPM